MTLGGVGVRASGGGVTHADPDALRAEDVLRWGHPPVVAFRKKLAPWMFAGGVSIVVAVFGGPDFAGLWGMYSIYIAWKYAKLWSDGYDWRDVLKEPKDRMFFDVVAEWVDSVRAVWDPRKRAEVRERHRLRSLRGGPLFERAGSRPSVPAGHLAPNELAALAGPHARAVQEARRNRDEILRMIETLSKRDRELMRDVPSSAMSLYQRAESLAVSVAGLERNTATGSATQVDAEIARLESEANPLDTDASEKRIRRLAHLKRQRRVVADSGDRLRQGRERLESCLVALQSMRLEIVRLRSGPQDFQTITSVAEKALALGREVDTAMYVKDEMAKLKLGGRGSGAIGR